MDAVTSLADHIERTYTGPMWHGPALKELVRDISPETAAARPIPSAHSIWEIVLHMTVWATIARKRLTGDALGTPPPEEDWPPVPRVDAAAWLDALNQLEQSYLALGRVVARLPKTALSELVPTDGPPHTVWTLLHGVIEHGTYHGGQIAILKRAI
jgi:uncharacterized damage-inducible protein DinB